MNSKVAKEICEERGRAGAYKSLDNFLRRITLGLEQIRILIRMGSFRFTGKSKQQLLWEAMLYFGTTARSKTTIDLFDTEPTAYPLPVLHRNILEDAFDEIELLGFSLCDPFQLLATDERGNTTARNLKQQVGRHVHLVGYVVTTKNTSTLKGDAMYFGTFYDAEGEFFDTVHFPDIARRHPFRGRGFYSIKGKVVEDFGVAMIEVTWMDKLPLVNKRAEQFMCETPSENKGVMAT
jgi:DNA polymerase-3 subunit alpha